MVDSERLVFRSHGPRQFSVGVGGHRGGFASLHHGHGNAAVHTLATVKFDHQGVVARCIVEHNAVLEGAFLIGHVGLGSHACKHVVAIERQLSGFTHHRADRHHACGVGAHFGLLPCRQVVKVHFHIGGHLVVTGHHGDFKVRNDVDQLDVVDVVHPAFAVRRHVSHTCGVHMQREVVREGVHWSAQQFGAA